MLRVFAAFLIAPALVPLLMLASAGARRLDGWQGALAVAGYTYATAILVGPFAVWWFRRRCWHKLWHFALGGAAIGTGPVLLSAIGTPSHLLATLVFVVVFGAVGLLSAMLFWLISVPKNAWWLENPSVHE